MSSSVPTPRIYPYEAPIIRPYDRVYISTTPLAPITGASISGTWWDECRPRWDDDPVGEDDWANDALRYYLHNTLTQPQLPGATVRPTDGEQDYPIPAIPERAAGDGNCTHEQESSNFPKDVYAQAALLAVMGRGEEPFFIGPEIERTDDLSGFQYRQVGQPLVSNRKIIVLHPEMFSEEVSNYMEMSHSYIWQQLLSKGARAMQYTFDNNRFLNNESLGLNGIAIRAAASIANVPYEIFYKDIYSRYQVSTYYGDWPEVSGLEQHHALNALFDACLAITQDWWTRRRGNPSEETPQALQVYSL